MMKLVAKFIDREWHWSENTILDTSTVAIVSGDHHHESTDVSGLP